MLQMLNLRARVGISKIFFAKLNDESINIELNWEICGIAYPNPFSTSSLWLQIHLVVHEFCAFALGLFQAKSLS